MRWPSPCSLIMQARSTPIKTRKYRNAKKKKKTHKMMRAVQRSAMEGSQRRTPRPGQTECQTDYQTECRRAELWWKKYRMQTIFGKHLWNRLNISFFSSWIFFAREFDLTSNRLLQRTFQYFWNLIIILSSLIIFIVFLAGITESMSSLHPDIYYVRIRTRKCLNILFSFRGSNIFKLCSECRLVTNHPSWLNQNPKFKKHILYKYIKNKFIFYHMIFKQFVVMHPP